MTATTLPINIDDVLNQRTVESERIDYKEGFNPETILHTICAFANDFHNLGSGYIIIGIAEQDGLPILPPKGLDKAQIDAIQKELLKLERNDISPPCNSKTAVYDIQGKKILVLWVNAGEMRPYKAKTRLGKDQKEWAYYIRKHTSTVKATGADEQELLSLANKIPFDDRYCQSASIEDLEPHLMREFLIEIDSDLAIEAPKMSLEELGRALNVIGGVPELPYPKNVGLLFFNRHPERFFADLQIDVVYFPDGAGGDDFEEKIFQGALGQITKDVLAYIKNRYIHEKVIKIPNQAKAERYFNYPFTAVEEAVVNAVYHRSYEERNPIEIRIEQDELVVISYPGPDRSIKLSDLQQGKVMARRNRNRRIGEFLKDLELTEGRATGLPKIFRAMNNNGSPLPIFETNDDRDYFMIRLPIHPQFLQHDEKQDERQDKIQAEIQVGDQVANLLLGFGKQTDTAFTTTELMEKLQAKSRPTFSKNYIKPALAQHLIEMTLPDKPNSPKQKYQLTAQGKQLVANLARKTS